MLFIGPMHWQETIEKLNLRFGISRMKHREQKHQIIKTYSDNTADQNRWHHVFRHKFKELVYLATKTWF